MTAETLAPGILHECSVAVKAYSAPGHIGWKRIIHSFIQSLSHDCVDGHLIMKLSCNLVMSLSVLTMDSWRACNQSAHVVMQECCH